MGDAYPELRKGQAHVEKGPGRKKNSASPRRSTRAWRSSKARSRLDGTGDPGDVVFKLYDTYGFPVDLTADIARERGLTARPEGIRRRPWRAARPGARGEQVQRVEQRRAIETDAESEFLGYEGTEGSCEVVALYNDGQPVDTARPNLGEEGAVVLSSTPFYAESGGQIGDTGILAGPASCFRSSTRRSPARRSCTTARSKQARYCVGDKVEAHRRRRAPSGDSPESLGDTPHARCVASRCWASMCSRRARWSRRIACVSISRTTSR